jgi:hypothetical protein
MEVKEGTKTSEFKLAVIIPSIVSLMVVAGIVRGEDQEMVVQIIEAIVVGIVGVVSAVSYISGRTKVKVEAMRLNADSSKLG